MWGRNFSSPALFQRLSGVQIMLLCSIRERPYYHPLTGENIFFGREMVMNTGLSDTQYFDYFQISIVEKRRVESFRASGVLSLSSRSRVMRLLHHLLPIYQLIDCYRVIFFRSKVCITDSVSCSRAPNVTIPYSEWQHNIL